MKCESCTKYDDCRTGSGLTWPCGAYRPKAGSGTDIEKLVEDLRIACAGNQHNIMGVAATALSTLQAENARLRAYLEYEREHANAYYEECGQWEAENEKLRAELEQERANRLHAEQYADAFLDDCKQLNAELERVKRLYESEKEDFIDYACSGVPNLSPYCMNRRPDCVDERGWCRSEKCHGFSRERGQKED